MIRIGYACITVGINKTYKTCRLKNLNEENLMKIIEHNLNLLDEVIEYNRINNIYLFRITSDLIPFGSSSLNTFDWQKVFSSKLKKIGEKVKKYNMRVSMHPGQYTVLNSKKKEIVNKSIDDLIYHNKVLTAMKLNSESKMILHIGGVYDNKEESKKRFINNYLKLPNRIKERLVIENDDKSYNIKDLLEISKQIDVPVVYDNLHNKINKYDENDDCYWIKKVSKTWKKKDGIQKIHYSEQNESKQIGSHSETINTDSFKEFISKIDGSLDIMLEVKDKDLSAIKCISATIKDKNNRY